MPSRARENPDQSAPGAASDQSAQPLEVAKRRKMPDLYVLDRAFNVVMFWGSGKSGNTDIYDSVERRLLPAVDRVVRQVVAGLQGNEALGLVPPSLILRIVELDGSAGLHYGVFAEAYQSRDSMREAGRRYGISRRELEVLNLLVQGAATGEIAAQLHIAETTVQDHIKSIAAKTHARSRTEIVAKVLGPGT